MENSSKSKESPKYQGRPVRALGDA